MCFTSKSLRPEPDMLGLQGRLTHLGGLAGVDGASRRGKPRSRGCRRRLVSSLHPEQQPRQRGGGMRALPGAAGARTAELSGSAAVRSAGLVGAEAGEGNRGLRILDLCSGAPS